MFYDLIMRFHIQVYPLVERSVRSREIISFDICPYDFILDNAISYDLFAQSHFTMDAGCAKKYVSQIRTYTQTNVDHVMYDLVACVLSV